MPGVNWKNELIDQLTFDWDYMFLPRMEGLTDEEYLWAPVEDVWTVHAGVNGELATVDPQRMVEPAPFTTIAWRLHHLTRVFGVRWHDHFGNGMDGVEFEIGLTAADGMRIVQESYERWRDSLLAMPSERLSQPCGPIEPFPEASFAALVLHISRECIHHAAECCLIRDLYRQRDTLHM
ncbi:MAG: DinB family protein [Thermomicrobiales bacterium]|nr:DinB family protein [Thermomicrobiales bacterium]